MEAAGIPDRSPDSLGSSPEIETARSRKILLARTLLTRLNGYERYARRRGEVDDEEWHHHVAARKQATAAIGELSTADQELLEAAFPLDGATMADVDDTDTRKTLASEFGIEKPGELHRKLDEALERFAEVYYRDAL